MLHFVNFYNFIKFFKEKNTNNFNFYVNFCKNYYTLNVLFAFFILL